MDPDEIAARRERLMDGLRAFGASYAAITRRFAAHLGLGSTDATALVEILVAEDEGRPITPARLGTRIGLTSGATTNLLNRIEAAGYVERHRDQADRRRVTVRSGPGIGGPARAFFGDLLVGELDPMLARYPREHLVTVEAFLDDLRTTMNAALARPDPR